MYQNIFDKIDSCVITVFKKIYKTMTNIEVTQIEPKNLNDFLRNYSTTMGLNGYFTEAEDKKTRFKGNVIICWQIDGYLKMASNIMGEEYKEYCADISDVGMEVLNTTVGNSKPLLNENKISVEMSLPTGFVGNQFDTTNVKNIYSKTHVFDSEAGKVCIIVNCSTDE